MKAHRIVVGISILLLALSCAGSPGWFNNPPGSRIKYYGTGSSQLKSPEKARKFAVMRAQEALAAQIGSRMQQAALDYYQENELAPDAQAIAFVEQVARQLVNVELKYTHVEELQRRSGVTYALVSLRSADLRRAMRERRQLKREQAKESDKSRRQALKIIEAYLDR